MAGGHVLLEGVPGLAKTLVVKTLADAIHGTFSRIQFTPDMLPGDVVGTQVFNPREGTYSVRKGPVFGNFMLADEINRAPAKVQSALLEAMQERQVTIGEHTTRCPIPSWSWPPRTRSSRRAPTPCPRPSSTASCSRSRSATRARTTRSASSTGWPAPAASRARPTIAVQPAVRS
jgi:hypothetical protein